MYDFYEILNIFNYYYYQPGSNIKLYIANTSRTHTCTHPPTHTAVAVSLFDGSVCLTARSAGDNSCPLAIEINSCVCEAVFAIVLDVFRV